MLKEYRQHTEERAKLGIPPLPRQNYHLTFADFYAGIGGFRLGLEKIGWHCTFTNENNPDCIKTYNLNFNDSVSANNIENLQF